MPSKHDTWLATWLDDLERWHWSLTLFLQGLVVTGEVVSPSEYFQGLGEQLGSIAEEFGNSDQTLRSMFSALADGSEAQLAAHQARLAAQNALMPPVADRTPEQYEAVERLVRNYIHLRDVTAIMGGAVTVNVGFWRGRLSEIAGWCVGRATIGPSNTPNARQL